MTLLHEQSPTTIQVTIIHAHIHNLLIYHIALASQLPSCGATTNDSIVPTHRCRLLGKKYAPKVRHDRTDPNCQIKPNTLNTNKTIPSLIPIPLN